LNIKNDFQHIPALSRPIITILTSLFENSFSHKLANKFPIACADLFLRYGEEKTHQTNFVKLERKKNVATSQQWHHVRKLIKFY